MLQIILTSLRKRIRKFILVFIQFFIGLTVLLFGIYSIEKFFRYQKNVEEVMPLETKHVYGLEDETVKSRGDYPELLKEIQKNNPSLKLGVFQEVLIEENAIEVSYLMCDQGVMDIFYDITEGSKMQQLKNYQGEEIVPVLISEDLSSKYKDGEVYPFPDDTISKFDSYKMKIVGILEEGKRICTGGSSDLSSSIKIAVNTIVGPKLFAFDADYAYIYNLVCISPDSFDLETEFLKSGWEVKIESVRDEIIKYFEREKIVMYGAVGFSIILLVLSVIGCVGTLLFMIFSRKEEFGIYFSLGMQKKNLALLVLGEVIMIFTVSYLFALFIFGLIIHDGLGEEPFVPVGTVLITLGIMFLCVLLCVILPIGNVMKWNPVELLSDRKE